MNPFKQDHLVAMIAAPIVWAVHFLLVYILVSLACGFGWNDGRLIGLDPAEFGIAVATLAALALIAYIAVLNLRKYRRALAAPTSRFIALTALLLGVLSAVAVVWVALPTFMLPTCMQ
jgi:hypothetical protein